MSRSRIASTSNPRVKAWSRLSEPKERQLQGLTVVEGRAELEILLESGRAISVFIYCAELSGANDPELAARLERSAAESFDVSEPVMRKIAFREHPDAWLCLAAGMNTTREQFIAACSARNSALYLVLSDVEKPGNIGAVMRSAEALGVCGLILASCRTDLGNPNVIRASKATAFLLPVWQCSDGEALAFLEAEGAQVILADPDAEKELWDVEMPSRTPVAFVFGAEHEGLATFWKQSSAARASIPMQGKINSLNVAQCVTLFLYEYLGRARH